MQKTEFINLYEFVHFSKLNTLEFELVPFIYLYGSFELNNQKTIFIEFVYCIN